MSRSSTWALVTNGVRARLLRNLEDGNSDAPIELISKAHSTHLRDLLADRSGRSFASVGDGRRSAMEPGSDPIYRDMQDFARETLDTLERYRRLGKFDRLAIFAAPKMLGILRREMPATLAQTVFLERASNLIRLPESELRSAVRRMLKAQPQEQ